MVAAPALAQETTDLDLDLLDVAIDDEGVVSLTVGIPTETNSGVLSGQPAGDDAGGRRRGRHLGKHGR